MVFECLQGWILHSLSGYPAVVLYHACGGAAAFQPPAPQRALVHADVFPSASLSAVRLLSAHVCDVEVPLNGSMTLSCLGHFSHFYIIRLAGGGLLPIIQTINMDVEH